MALWPTWVCMPLSEILLFPTLPYKWHRAPGLTGPWQYFPTCQSIINYVPIFHLPRMFVSVSMQCSRREMEIEKKFNQPINILCCHFSITSLGSLVLMADHIQRLQSLLFFIIDTFVLSCWKTHWIMHILFASHLLVVRHQWSLIFYYAILLVTQQDVYLLRIPC